MLNYVAILLLVLAFKEPKSEEESKGQSHISYGEILKQAISIMRARPALRYAMLYLTVVPLAAVAMETVFLQPQAIALGIPLAGVGVVIMAAQFSNMAGATISYRVKEGFGETQIIYLAPYLIATSLFFLGLFQQLPALFFAAAISFFTALIRPVVMTRIQNEVSDSVRATIISMQSLIFAFVIAFIEPLLGYVADLRGLPAAYYLLAGGLVFILLLLFWRSRTRFP